MKLIYWSTNTKLQVYPIEILKVRKAKTFIHSMTIRRAKVTFSRPSDSPHTVVASIPYVFTVMFCSQTGQVNCSEIVLFGLSMLKINGFQAFSEELDRLIPFKGDVYVNYVLGDSELIKVLNVPVQGVLISWTDSKNLPIIYCEICSEKNRSIEIQVQNTVIWIEGVVYDIWNDRPTRISGCAISVRASPS